MISFKEAVAYWLVGIMIVVAALILSPSAHADGWQLYWQWSKHAGRFYNGTMSGSPASFSFSGSGATCTGSGVIGGPATVECSADSWNAQGRGVLERRGNGFVFYGKGYGYQGEVNNTVNYLILGVTG